MLPPLLLEIGNHSLEVAEVLIQVGRFLVLFIAARLMAELMVRLSLPTILGELLADEDGRNWEAGWAYAGAQTEDDSEALVREMLDA
jgi:hypothetical protein